MSICAFAISMWIEIYTVKYNAHIPLALEFIIINFAFIFGVLGIKHWADYLRLRLGNFTAATENGNTMQENNMQPIEHASAQNTTQNNP